MKKGKVKGRVLKRIVKRIESAISKEDICDSCHKKFHILINKAF